MKVNLAIKSRILELCKKHNLSINGLATQSMITQSTLNSFMNSDERNISIITLFKICYAFDISVKDFFDSKIFNDVEIDF